MSPLDATEAKTKTLAKEPSLLSGLLFDDRGNPMSPTHATKGGRRYRYYVSQALLQYRDAEAGSVVRVPAQTLEELVTAQLLSLMEDSRRLLSVIETGNLSGEQHQRLLHRAHELVKGWVSLPFSAQIEHLGSLSHRITLGRDEIRIAFSRSDLLAASVPEARLGIDKVSATDDFEATVPVRLKRCGVETRLIVQKRNVLPGASFVCCGYSRRAR